LTSRRQEYNDKKQHVERGQGRKVQ
jgi:hypothetical protein